VVEVEVGGGMGEAAGPRVRDRGPDMPGVLVVLGVLVVHGCINRSIRGLLVPSRPRPPRVSRARDHQVVPLDGDAVERSRRGAVKARVAGLLYRDLPVRPGAATLSGLGLVNPASNLVHILLPKHPFIHMCPNE
jgi:hypothetical protein